jgi:hypothetical protein
MNRGESGDQGAVEAGNMTPPSTGNAEDAEGVETPELTHRPGFENPISPPPPAERLQNYV